MNQLRERGDISTGELLDGRYRLVERIGEGGMARVYRADDTALGRTVAVKILRGPVDGLASVERAHSESKVLASLNHHGLVTLFDAHVSDDGSYLVMEYVEGITLQERIHRGPMASSEAAQLTIDVAEALHAAHSAGIVHRDIKPSNVLLSRSPLPGHEWRAKIADFGIACLQDSARLTAPGIMVGTVAYIAPEQARGEPPAPAADIYALGILLIEALTGKRPFAEAEGIGAVMARLQGPPPVSEQLDERWQHLLRGMTATLPGDRPTALEVAVAAARIASDSEVSAAASTDAAEPTTFVPDVASDGTTAVLPLTAPVGVAIGADDSSGAVRWESEPARRARAPRRRNRAFLAALVLVLLLVASVVGAAFWAASPPAGVLEPTPSQPVQEEVVEPSVVPTPADENVAPVDDTNDGDNSGPGNGNGNGNGNSGPGNNNGNGNGNSGPGNNNGNGSND